MKAGLCMMVVAVLTLAAVTVAHADDDAKLDPFDAAHGSNERGSKLFDQGRELLKQGKLDEACVQFDESWRIERALGTQLNLANCREHQGKLVEAFELFGGAAQQAEAQHDRMRAAFATERAHNLEHRLGLITINLATPIASGTIVTIDGDVVPTGSSIVRHVDPRKLFVAATGPTGVLSSATLTLSPGGTAIVDMPTLEERPRHIRKTRLIVGAALVLVGIAGSGFLHPAAGVVPIVVGAYFMITTGTERGPVVIPPSVRSGGPAGL